MLRLRAGNKSTTTNHLHFQLGKKENKRPATEIERGIDSASKRMWLTRKQTQRHERPRGKPRLYFIVFGGGVFIPVKSGYLALSTRHVNVGMICVE